MPETIDSCPNNGDKILSDKPPYPHINCVEGVSLSVHWGWIGKGFLLAIVTGFSTTAWLSYEAVATDEELAEVQRTDAQIQKQIIIVDRNMHKLDEQQRIQASQTGLIVKQMNKLLELGGVTERIEAPPIKPSELEPIE
jgi:hypothetical protein